uniref:Protein tweety homolog n=1 Tax=Timema monikensis TaxID=170555 RepID=A0A7R9EA96_9NEOP|nr:unnamed protein product [Timema monikensis]
MHVQMTSGGYVTIVRGEGDESCPRQDITLRTGVGQIQTARDLHRHSLHSSLGILGSLPAAWLILTLLVLLIYLLTRCCDRKPRPKRSIVALKWTLAIFTLLCCAAVGVGLYGNDDVHNALEQLITAAKSIDDYITSIRNQTGTIESTLQQKIQPLLTELGDIFDNPVANQTARGMLLTALASVTGNTSTALTCVQDISRPIQDVSIKEYVQVVQTCEIIRYSCNIQVLIQGVIKDCVQVVQTCETIRYSCNIQVLIQGVIKDCVQVVQTCETIRYGCNIQVLIQGVIKDCVQVIQTCEIIRWPVTMAVLSILLVFCVVLLFGVARHSRCALITFSVFGLFAVIISWLMASMYLASSVALGDLCISPGGYLDRQAGSDTKADILNYYIHCDNAHMHPFNQRWQQGKNAVKAMSSNLAMVTKLARELYKPTDLNPKLDVVATEVKQADSLVSALATMLDCNAFHKQYVKAVDSVCDLGLRDYLQVDEQDPFLPPSAASQAIAARTLRSQGSYGSTGFFRSRNSSHHHTPPPTPPYPGTLDGRASREEKSQHGSHHESASSGGLEYGPGTSTMPGPNHGQYATLSKQCKTLESSDFY